MRRGELREFHIVHWESFDLGLPPRRNITPTDMDGQDLFGAGIEGGRYSIEFGRGEFTSILQFELKHEGASYLKPNGDKSGQIKAIDRYICERLAPVDLFVWMTHNATGSTWTQGERKRTIYDIYPENITAWSAYQGMANSLVERGSDLSKLATLIGFWVKEPRPGGCERCAQCNNWIDGDHTHALVESLNLSLPFHKACIPLSPHAVQ